MIEKPSIKSNLSVSEHAEPLKHSSCGLPALFLEQIKILIKVGDFQNKSEFIRIAVRNLLKQYFPEMGDASANKDFTTIPLNSKRTPSKKVDRHKFVKYNILTKGYECLCGACFDTVKEIDLHLGLPTVIEYVPSKKLDKDGIDYIPVCGDCCHWLSQRNYCLKRKWDAYANSEGCESFAYTDEDTQGSMIEKGGAEE